MRRFCCFALPLLASFLVAGCSDGFSAEKADDVDYTGTLIISKELDSGSTDLVWEDLDRFEVSFGSGTQSFGRTTLERNHYQVSLSTSPRWGSELTIKGYDREGKLIVLTQKELALDRVKNHTVVLSPVYDGDLQGSVSIQLFWQQDMSVSKVELLDDEDDSLLASKEIAEGAIGTCITLSQKAVTKKALVRARLYGSDGTQIGYTQAMPVKIAANLANSYTLGGVLAGTEPVYVPEPARDLKLYEASPTSLTYQFTLPESYDALEVIFDGNTTSYAFGNVPEMLTFEGLEPETEHTLSLVVLHTHKKKIQRSEKRSLAGKTLILPLTMSIDETYRTDLVGNVYFSATTNRKANLVWTSSDSSILQVTDEAEGVFKWIGSGSVTVSATEGEVCASRTFSFQEPPKGDVAITITGADLQKPSITLTPQGPYHLADRLTFSIADLDEATSASWYLDDRQMPLGIGSSITLTASQFHGLTEADHLLVLVLDDGKKRYSASIPLFIVIPEPLP